MTLSRKKPKNPTLVAVDAIERFMLKKNYRLCDGTIYKKAPDAKYTFVYCCSVKDFLLKTLANEEISEVLTPQIYQVIQLLSEPSCRLIKPIKILYNFVEVLPSCVIMVLIRRTLCQLVFT